MTIRPPTDGVRDRPWTKEESYRLGEQGYFHGLGHRYAQRTDRLAGDVVSPLGLPGVAILVADLLP